MNPVSVQYYWEPYDEAYDISNSYYRHTYSICTDKWEYWNAPSRCWRDMPMPHRCQNRAPSSNVVAITAEFAQLRLGFE